MDKENLKILSYDSGVSSLPDYPSDAGYTAEALKAVFDARSDKEIKEKHNALVDELGEHSDSENAHPELFEKAKQELSDLINAVSSTVEEHKTSDAAHAEIFDDVVSGIVEYYDEKEKNYVKKTEVVQEYKPNGYTEEEKTLPISAGAIEGIKEPLSLNIKDGEGEASLEQKAWSEASLNSATGKGSVALGGYNKANAKCSMSVNYNNEVNAENAFAANQSNKIPVEASGAFVAGLANEAKGAYQAIFGTYSDVESTDAFVVGNGASANGKKNAFKVDKYGNTGISGDAEIGGKLKVADTAECKTLTVGNVTAAQGLTARGKIYIGNGVLTEKDGDFAQNIVEGGGSFAFGGSNKIYGRNCVTFMSSNTIPERSLSDKMEMESVFIAGHANTATGPHQAIFGTYADPKESDVFVIGNGDKNGKKNAFAVNRDGSVRIGGTQIALGNTVITEDDVKTLLNLVASAGESV